VQDLWLRCQVGITAGTPMHRADLQGCPSILRIQLVRMAAMQPATPAELVHAPNR
jgi:hypothetical protein